MPDRPLPMVEASESTRQRELRHQGLEGYVHSHDSCSGLDGPGLRYVLWTSGCLMRCQYCHNPDTWALTHGTRMHVDDVVAEVRKYAPFLRAAKGGFTVSGGEPMAQAPFVFHILRRVREIGLHTAIDTNGYLGDRATDEHLDLVDLFLLDIKSFEPQLHKELTGVDVRPILHFAERLAALARPAWVRFVLVPGLTDHPGNVVPLAQFVAGLGNVAKVQVFPFHQMGRTKWQQLGQTYPLADQREPTAEEIDTVRSIFADAGCTVAEG